jgi:hypothetical protein
VPAQIVSEIQQAVQSDQRRGETGDRFGGLFIQRQPCQALAEMQGFPFSGSPVRRSCPHAPMPGAGVEVVEPFPRPWPLLVEGVNQDVYGLPWRLTVQGGLQIEFPSVDGGQTLASQPGLTGEVEERQGVGRHRLQAMTIRTGKEQKGRSEVSENQTGDLAADLLGPFPVIQIQGLSQVIDPAAVATADQGVGPP